MPLIVAGQCEEQRPHSVQEYMSSTCFQVNWLMYEVPNVVAFSRSCLLSAPVGSSFLKKTFGIAVMTWKCLLCGSRFRKMSGRVACVQNPAIATVRRVDPRIRRRHARLVTVFGSVGRGVMAARQPLELLGPGSSPGGGA